MLTIIPSCSPRKRKHNVHDPIPLRHVHRRLPPIRNRPSSHRGEPDFPWRRVLPEIPRRRGRCRRRSQVQGPHGQVHRGEAPALVSYPAKLLTQLPPSSEIEAMKIKYLLIFATGMRILASRRGCILRTNKTPTLITWYSQ